jgi:hypothetical protein
MRTVIVFPPDEQGGRRVRSGSEILGLATSLKDVVEFLRRAGLDEVDEVYVRRTQLVEWRGGGPDVWEH